jgi:hypothetical protein
VCWTGNVGERCLWNHGRAADWSVAGFDPYNPDGIASHHIAAGLLGLVGGIFHLCVRPTLGLYSTLRMGNIETVLASSIAVVSWASTCAAATMWYGSATTPIEFFGPTRYQWDSGYFQIATERSVQLRRADGKSVDALGSFQWRNSNWSFVFQSENSLCVELQPDVPFFQGGATGRS